MSDHSGFKPPDDEPGHDDVHDDAEGIRVVGPSNPMPHWTEPATGEMPRLLFDEEPAAPDEDLEAWSSFAATPRWRSSADDWDDDTDIAEFGDSETRVGALDSGSEESSGVFVFDDTTEPPTDPAPAVTPIRTGTRSAPAPAPAPAAAAAAAGAAGAKSTTARKQPAPTNRPGGGGPANTGGPAADRDLPVAIGVGVALAVVALVLFSIGPGAAMGLVTLVIAAAAAEFYAAMQKVAYQPATLLGIVACAGMPLAAYWRGEGAIPLVLVLSVVFGLLWFLLAAEDVRPGAEPRRHAPRRRVRRPARLVRRADPPVPERRRDVARRDHRNGRVRRRRPVRRLERRPLTSRARGQPEQDLEGLIGGMLMAVLAVGGDLRSASCRGITSATRSSSASSWRSPLRSATSASR